jgi:hypothetical protein
MIDGTREKFLGRQANTRRSGGICGLVRNVKIAGRDASGTGFGAIRVNGVSLWIGGTTSTTPDREILKLRGEFVGLQGTVKNAGWQPALRGFWLPLSQEIGYVAGADFYCGFEFAVFLAG